MEELKNAITEEELKIRAIDFYDKYKKDEELLKLIQNEEFLYTLSKIYDLINKNPNKTTSHKITIKSYSSIEEKKRIMEDKYNMSQYKLIMLKDKTELIELYDSDKVVAYAFISYENELDFGKYGFLHFMGFRNSEDNKYYKNFEKLIVQKLKNRNIQYFDRIISFKYDNENEDRVLEEIKDMGYMCIWKNSKIKLNIKNCSNLSVIGDIRRVKHIEMDYTGIGKVIPARFESKNDIYEGSLEKDKFFINVISKDEKAFVNIYMYNGKIDDKNYIKQVYKLTFKFLSEHNIKELVTFISPDNIILLRDNINLDILQNIYWLRKEL
ncbi:hypothetical protein [Clostridium sp. OS1-26]|uniref:hypothetical protein n=1 Tax=Clostridium sp. OS1-26 TaxID=3070681 RepID=UPI0027E111E4|nr:hypothetical protein [Clostridium sp. OS1-26]WML35827.1 hypothetical protein RCG18_03505 [Clostridium sp. OS1-26]